jgi:hypothetical protein
MPSAQHSGKSVIRAGISKETSLLLLAGGQGVGGGGREGGKGWHATGQNIRLFLCTRPVFLSMHTYLLYKLPTSCTYLHTVHDSTGYTYTQTVHCCATVSTYPAELDPFIIKQYSRYL